MKVITSYRTTLSQNMTSTQSTVPVSSLSTDDATPHTITAADFDSYAFLVIEPGGARQEIVSVTGVGTLEFTGATRGLAFYGGTPSAVTDNQYAHQAGSTVIMSNVHYYYDELVDTTSDETIGGVKTFTSSPIVPDPTGLTDAANKEYVLSVVTGGPISINSLIVAATAGETIAAGNLVYFDETQNEWMKCDADTAASVQSTFLGIAQSSGTDGNPITGGVCIMGVDSTGSGMTQGDLLFASNTAGGINSGTPGTTPRVLGIATSATVRYFNPFFQQELTRYAVDAVGTDSYAVTLPGNFSAYYAGMAINFKAGTANTGAATLAVNGGAAKAIVKGISTALVTGDIQANQIVSVVYDGTNFVIVNSPVLNVPIVRTYLNAGSPATWTKPAGLKYVVVEVQAGGGGGGGTTTIDHACGGGGGGGFARKVITVGTLGATETVTTGAGGTAGAATGGTGGTGGTSSFGAHVTASGGVGGTDATYGVGGAGGAGASGDFNTEGGDGGGGNGGESTLDVVNSGMGGSSHFGGGARNVGAEAGTVAGVDGNVYGGGGSGAANGTGVDAAGGAGAAGIVIVTEYYA